MAKYQKSHQKYQSSQTGAILQNQAEKENVGLTIDEVENKSDNKPSQSSPPTLDKKRPIGAQTAQIAVKKWKLLIRGQLELKDQWYKVEKNVICSGLLKIKQQKAMMALFSVELTSLDMRKTFL